MTVLDLVHVAEEYDVAYWRLWVESNRIDRINETRNRQRSIGYRLPAAPLLRWAPRDMATCDGQIMSPAGALARILEIEPNSVYHMRDHGISLNRADEIAARMNVHPSAIWGPRWDALCALACVTRETHAKTRKARDRHSGDQ